MLCTVQQMPVTLNLTKLINLGEGSVTNQTIKLQSGIIFLHKT
jgi:hypothetical protein